MPTGNDLLIFQCFIFLKVTHPEYTTQSVLYIAIKTLSIDKNKVNPRPGTTIHPYDD